MSSPTKNFEGSYKEIVKNIHDAGRLIFYPDGYRRVIFTNGCFDILHRGHLQTLRHARYVAGHMGAVVVGINSDESVKRIKGADRPIFDQETRATILVSLKFVDHVVVFDEDNPYELIRQLRPDVIVKGGDYTPNKVVGADLAPVSIASFDPKWSTTDIVKRIKGT